MLELDAELPLYNKVGDLYLKLNKGAEAADMYEKAVKRYIETGLENNAIALCSKLSFARRRAGHTSTSSSRS